MQALEKTFQINFAKTTKPLRDQAGDQANDQCVTLPQVLIACSGGLDSIALANLVATLYKAKKQLQRVRICHIDHGQRSTKAAQKDEHAVLKLCSRHNLSLEILHLNAPKNSSEAALRKLRYQALFEIASKNEILLTGHHADDQIETFFLRIIRGASPEDFRGIEELSRQKENIIFRPLLQFSKVELKSYAKSKRLKWNEDTTNLSSKFARNRIRHELLPLFEDLRPNALKHLLSFFNAIANTNQKLHQNTSVNLTLGVDFKNQFGDLDFIEFKHILESRLGEFSSRTTRAHWIQLKKQWEARKASKNGGGPRKTIQFPGNFKAIFEKTRFFFTQD